MDNPLGPLAAELPYLAAFHTVCAEGGISAAARRLGCSQPAVSYQVRRLEQLLGTKLFERSGRRVLLTPEGKRFRLFADQVLSDLAHARSECVSARRFEPLRLGSVSGFGRYVLLPALHRLRAEQGDANSIEIRLQYDAADAVLERLEAGDYEAAFVYKRKVSSALVFEEVYREEFVLVGNPELAIDSIADDVGGLRTLERMPFVTYEECDYVFGRWFDACFGAQPAHVISRSHFTELEEVIDFVARGVGLSVVPLDAAEAAIMEDEVAILRAGSGRACLNPVYRVLRAGSEPRPLLDRLTEIVATRDR